MSPERRYHHGNLRAALLDAGYELAREGGPEAVVLREASRRVGVSHNAAYRHFADREALLEAVAARCMEALAQQMEARIAAMAAEAERAGAAPGEIAAARLTATGREYVGFALGEPGLFRAAFSTVEHGADGTPAAAIGSTSADGQPGPFEILNRELDGLVSAGVMDPDDRPLAEFAAWSAVHGFSMLCLDGPLGEMPEEARDAALARTLGAVQGGLTRARVG